MTDTASAAEGRLNVASSVDVGALLNELRRTVNGEVRFRPGDRALYSGTGSNYRQLPIGVVVPRTIDDVVATIAACRTHGAPVLSRGGGTSLAGQCCNVAVILDFSKYLNRIIEIDPVHKLARVEPGVVLDRLREAAEEHRLTFGPDPSTHDHCTLGGMIGNNSCGVRSVMSQFYGPGPRTSDNVHELEVLTYRGERMRVGEGGGGIPPRNSRTQLTGARRSLRRPVRERYPDIPRRVSGYNLDDLLPETWFPCRACAVGHRRNLRNGARGDRAPDRQPSLPHPARCWLRGCTNGRRPRARRAGAPTARPRGRRRAPDRGHDDAREAPARPLASCPTAAAGCSSRLGGETKEEADDKARAVQRDLERAGGGLRGVKIYDDEQSEQHVWGVREAGLGATRSCPASRTPTRAGRTRPSRRSGSASTCAR